MKLIANNWNEISIGMWQDIEEILNEDTDTVDKNVRLVGYMYDIPDETAYDLPLDEFSAALDGIGWLGHNPSIPEPSPEYLINGKKYIVSLNPTKVTTAQYIDFRSCNTDVPKNIHRILSCIIIPEGHSYNDGYDMEEVQKDIRNYMIIPHALSLVRFFFQLYRALTVNSLRSLIRTLRKQLKKEKNQEERERIMERIEKTENLERMFGSLV